MLEMEKPLRGEITKLVSVGDNIILNAARDETMVALLSITLGVVADTVLQLPLLVLVLLQPKVDLVQFFF